MNPLTSKSIGRFLVISVLVLILFFGYTVVSTLHTLHSTGLLRITTSDSAAAITISGMNKKAERIGTGSADIRIDKGSYLVTAVHNGRRAAAVVQVTLQHTTKANLNLASNTPVPSADNISFTGLDSLTNNGLTLTQIVTLKRLFFNYKQSAKNIMVDTTSIATGPHNPNSPDPTFSLSFTCTIDGASSNATVRYADLTDVQLILTDTQTGAQLYNSNSSPSS